jgi:hypothetical protein
MPFAQLPSSPGFVQPQAPDWTRFALQANENIQKGGEMRMKAGEMMAESIDKAAAQITGILKENSPEEKAAKALKLEATKAQLDLYNQYKTMTPEQRAATFDLKGGMLSYKDKYKNLLQGVRLSNSVLQGQLLNKRLAGNANPTLEMMRQAHAKGQYNPSLDNLSGPVVNMNNDSSSDSSSSGAADDAAALQDLGGTDETDNNDEVEATNPNY